MCIGAGYILIQVALIQKFVLFLGHPTYALTVIIFSMLISSGLGSYCSRRLTGESSNTSSDTGRLSAVLIGMAATVSALAYLAAPVSEFGVGWPLPLKALVTVGLIAPAGFLMGIPFPTGLTRLQKSLPASGALGVGVERGRQRAWGPPPPSVLPFISVCAPRC